MQSNSSNPSNFDATAEVENRKELEHYILMLQTSLGNELDLQEQEQSAQYLLNHPDQAHPYLLRLLQSGHASNPFAVIDVLPRFGRPESIPVLENLLLQGSENVRRAAGEALARHPLDLAEQSLIQGLTAPHPESVIAAADGLMSRGNSSACLALVMTLDTSPKRDNLVVRYHLIQAAASLGCFSRKELAAIANTDPNQEVRDLASQWIQGMD